MARRDPPEEEEPQTFTWPLLGALYGSLVIVAVVAVLNSHVGRSLDDKVDAPAQALVAVPVVMAAAVVAIASLVAMMAPEYRRSSLKVAEIGAWLIPAWLVIGAMVLGAISFALGHAD
jgi:uncharacterized membrane protein